MVKQCGYIFLTARHSMWRVLVWEPLLNLLTGKALSCEAIQCRLNEGFIYAIFKCWLFPVGTLVLPSNFTFRRIAMELFPVKVLAINNDQCTNALFCVNHSVPVLFWYFTWSICSHCITIWQSDINNFVERCVVTQPPPPFSLLQVHFDLVYMYTSTNTDNWWIDDDRCW